MPIASKTREPLCHAVPHPVNSLRLITPYFREHRVSIALGVLCLVAVDFLQLMIPQVIKAAVDDLTSFGVDRTGLGVYALQILGLALLIGLLRYVWRRSLIGTSRVIEEGLRNRLFEHVQRLGAAYFGRTKTGDIMARATNDIQHVRMATGMGVVALTDGIVLGAAAVGFMAYINLRLTLFVLIPMPMIVFGTRLLSRKMHGLYQETQAVFAEMTETVRELFAGVRIVKAYTGERAATRALGGISEKYVLQNLKLVRVTGFFFPMMLFFSNLSMVIVLFLGGRQSLTFTITPGEFVAFISYIGLLTWPMMAMGWVTNLIQRGKASLDRIDDILQTPPDIADRPGAVALTEARGRLQFEGVCFAYPGAGSAPALTEIDFTLEPGRVLGIVGPPGCGKTTLLQLIPRLYEAGKGRVLLDGIDIRDLRLGDLRSQIAFVPQEPFLFSGTLRDNLLAGVGIGEERLLQAADSAALLNTVEGFPDGFQTRVGEKGILLSGGQKQRVALARALLQDRPLLLLDDPISQVDVQTASVIIGTLRRMAGRRTLLIASHRISAVRFADRILVLDDGRITESGTHDLLVSSGGFYARTFRLQELEEQFSK